MSGRSGRSAAADLRLDGKVALVTGATGGMGKVVATELAGRGATLLLVGRDGTRTESVRQEIVAAIGNRAVEPFTADLADFGDVRRLAAVVAARHPALHLLVNNAGAFATEHRLNADGVEANLAVNFFSPFLLTNLLVDALIAGAPARVVNVGSAAMARRLNLDDLGPGRQPVGRRGYATAKLALLMSGYALARRLEGTGVTVNTLHPGVTATAIGGDAVPRPLRPLVGIAKAAAVRLSLVATPEQGARTTVLLATAPELGAVTGRYFVDERERPPPPVASDVELQEGLWRLSVRLVGLGPGAFGAAAAADRSAPMGAPRPGAAPRSTTG